MNLKGLAENIEAGTNPPVKKFGLALLILASAVGCDQVKKSKHSDSSNGEQKWQSAVSALAKQHHAIADWEQQIRDRTVKGPFTLDVSNALIQTNGQPVLLVMELTDVVGSDGSYTAQFTEEYVTNRYFKLIVEVKCAEEHAKRLLRTKDDLFPRYAVVARISEVSRPQFTVNGTRDEEGVRIELDASPPVFLAKGVCVDLLWDEPRPEPVK